MKTFKKTDLELVHFRRRNGLLRYFREEYFSFVVKGTNTKDEQTFVLRPKVNKPTETTLIFKDIWTGKN